ncbi:MAG: NAD(P)H-quinone oxidoreductase subunit L [Leptolyngbyaceae bacterium]|nr:NAD(P)H-quinone oxidoreductase subunit L [Leptolyngbyaceae bacterium]
MDFSFDTIINLISPEYWFVLALYVGLGGAYLVVGPGLTLWYLNQRWYVASSVERLLMYGAVFFFFPGLLLLSPFINYRPQPPQS